MLLEIDINHCTLCKEKKLCVMYREDGFKLCQRCLEVMIAEIKKVRAEILKKE